MTTGNWIKSNIGYDRCFVVSALEGARSCGRTSLEGSSVSSVLVRSVRTSGPAMAVGAYIGALGAAMGNRRKSNCGVVVVSTVLGAVIGLGTGMVWGTRLVTGNMARGAMENMNAARDARWLGKNPIDYA